MPFIQCHMIGGEIVPKYSIPLTIATAFGHFLSCLNPIQESWSFSPLLLDKDTEAEVGMHLKSI